MTYPGHPFFVEVGESSYLSVEERGCSQHILRFVNKIMSPLCSEQSLF